MAYVWKKMSEGEQSLFAEHMAHCLQSKVPLMEGLKYYGFSSKKHAPLMETLQRQVSEGKSLAYAMKRSGMFHGMMVSLVSMGEESGTLEKCFDALGSYYRWRFDLRQKIHRSLVYPFMLFCLLGSVLWIFLPSFLVEMEGFLTQLPGNQVFQKPLLFQVLSRKDLPLWVVGSLVGFLCVTPLMHRRFLGYYLDWMWLRLPGIRRITYPLFLESFLQTLVLQCEVGIHMREALAIQAQHVQNLYGKQLLYHLMEALDKGQPLSYGARVCLKMDQLTVQVLYLGEESGQLNRGLKRALELVSKKNRCLLGGIVENIQPLFLGLIGLFLIWVVISFFAPLYEALGYINI